MHVRNRTSRYHLIGSAIRLASAQNLDVAARAVRTIYHYEYTLQDYKHYIQEHGEILLKFQIGNGVRKDKRQETK